MALDRLQTQLVAHYVQKTEQVSEECACSVPTDTNRTLVSTQNALTAAMVRLVCSARVLLVRLALAQIQPEQNVYGAQ